MISLFSHAFYVMLLRIGAHFIDAKGKENR